MFWFDSKSTNQNSFQPFQKHLRVKQSVVSTKHVVFHLSFRFKKVLKHISFRFNNEWITILSYPDPTPNTTATPAWHQTLGFGYFKALDHS